MALTQIITFLLIGIGLSFDSFAVSISCGLVKKEIKFLQAVIVASVMAFSQALLPVIGWFVGSSVKDMITALDHWIAFGLLAVVGIKMIVEGLSQETKLNDFNPLNPRVLASLSIATSIDALAVGLSFGFLNSPIVFPAIIIGGVTFIASMLGMLFGKNIPAKRSRKAIILGGIILIGIGIKIVIEHLCAT